MSSHCAPGRRVSPRGLAPPRSPGRAAERAARRSGAGSGPGGPSARPGPGRGSGLLCRRGAGWREGKERRWEAPTPGQRRLPGNFVVKSKASEKEKRKPYPPSPARVSHAARRFCARGPLLCAAPLLPESAGQGWRRDAGDRRLGQTPCGRAAPAGGREESRRARRCPGVLPCTASWPGPCA